MAAQTPFDLFETEVHLRFKLLYLRVQGAGCIHDHSDQLFFELFQALIKLLKTLFDLRIHFALLLSYVVQGPCYTPLFCASR